MKPRRAAIKAFAAGTPAEKLERLLEAFPELTQPFIDQMDSIWCLRTSDQFAEWRGTQDQDAGKVGAA